MINADMRLYDFFTIGENDEYGQPQMPDYEVPEGKIKMCINITSQTIGQNINYKDATYMGLTNDKNIDDTYIIEYGNEKLKVLYINPKGRYTQVYMAEI